MDKPKVKRNNYVPEVIQEFPSLGNEQVVIKVRVVRYNHPYFGVSDPRLDIRKYLVDKENSDGTKYTGFTREGVSLTWDDINQFKDMLEDIINLMDTIDKPTKPKKG